ncbi:sugar ABC transporter ATP-binding protein [Hoeflea prorocentri]|uniref:Sugar ABC transporter ATP-binding protein n=1 Tax=Hoeflea prorocentri TaxID=1922333 RepID=A0A9X3UJ54_9HYPH|nr:sugar ABC transporter ATP-binding protein [Hoeflea prorocentri]MCY6381551.1 sugar ABC transporter ATP-binding protein [Hoeflea prorocentri]MDA5399351.1 sugar ABC transporter ATP-binding protein [Hoeflea prorocentri]
MSNVAVDMRGISKEFGPVKALDNVDLLVRKGSIHGLVGANGAGKSTIIKVLAGIYANDAGTITVDGKALETITPASIEKEGVHFIHQDRLLVPTATVAEAVFLNNEPRAGIFLNIRKMKCDAAALIQKYFDVEIDPNTLVRDLSAAKQKIVQITRALANNAKVLVLDEPTAALVSAEANSLFKVLRDLKNQGIAIVFISHYMQEIMDVCDDVTILRNGQNAGNVETSSTSIDEIVSLMVDRDASEMYPPRDHKIGKPILEIENLTRKGHFNDITMSLHSGEVLGLIGLLGSGDKQLLKCMFGLDQADSGSIRLNGTDRSFSAPSQAVRAGIAMIPEDRRAHGVAVDLTVFENISVASIDQRSNKGFVNFKEEAKVVDGLIGELGIKTPDRFLPVKNLSGGNQQKVVVAKWLSCDSSVYLLDDPTVAVDVGAKVEIYNLINRLAGEGKGLIFVSSDLEEAVEMCDRILVIYKGEIVGEYKRGEVDSNTLLAVASGASVDQREAS